MTRLLVAVPLVLGLIIPDTSSAAALAAVSPPKLKLSDPLPANLFVELARAINPSVVNISTIQRRPQRRQPPGYPQGGGPGGDPFWDFFEQFMGPQGQVPDQGALPQALGTGFIVEEDGLIVTNNHVVEGADQVKVQLIGDKKLYDAKVVGRDQRSDIAIIRISAGKKLPALALGSSTDIQVGEWVAAFGNPFGHAHSMSKGIVSAKGRAIREINAIPFIQTDASINPGNSGGPLVNTHGEVIGVNAAIDARAQGIGFAIPIDEVKNLVPQLLEKGKIQRAFLGVALAPYIHPQAARELRLPNTKGALVVNVEGGSPAEKGGVQPYDVIVKVGEREVENSDDLRLAVLDTPVGGSTKVELFREGKKKTVTIAFADRPEVKKQKAEPKPKAEASGDDVPFELGFKVARLTKELAKDLNVTYEASGPLVVSAIDPEGPSYRAGLHLGDIILDVNQKKCETPEDVKKNVKNGLNALRVRRDSAVTLIFIETK